MGIIGLHDGKNDLGNKGSRLLALSAMGLNVPDGFVIPPSALGNEQAILEGFTRCIGGHVFSVRSSPAQSMPGILETILNVGFNDAVFQQFQRAPWAAACYRKLIRDYAYLVHDVEDYTFGLLDKKYELNELLDAYLDCFAQKTGQPFPQDPQVQLFAGVRAVAQSMESIKAKAYRQKLRLPEQPAAVIVQKMVFGNRNDRSGSGVYFTRNPVTGEKAPYGEYRKEGQCDQVVQGSGSNDLSLLKEQLPEVYDALLNAGRRLEAAFLDVQDVEFTVEDGVLYLLQARDAQCTSPARRVIGQALEEEGWVSYAAYSKKHGIPATEKRKEIKGTVFCSGELINNGVAKGQACFNSRQAINAQKAGKPVILVVYHSLSLDMDALFSAGGIISVGGGKSSHFAVLVKQLNIPCVVLDDRVKLEKCQQLTFNGHVICAGDEIGLDGENVLLMA